MEDIYTETPDILPLPTDLGTAVLTPAQVRTLQDGTLRVLAEIGVHCPSDKALEIFAAHGADIDRKQKIVKLPQEMVRKTLDRAPRAFTLGGREERFDLSLDGNHTYLSTDGTGVQVVDLDTRKMRPSGKDDIALMARVSDALPMISFYWPMVSAQDYGPTAPLHQCHAALSNTLKHVRGGMTVPPGMARFAVEMATVVAGSEEERRARPPICANICTIAPLAHDKDGLETALVYAEAGIPTSFMAMPTMGSTAPTTPLGALVVGDAEVISGLVLIQLAHPGAPVFHSIITSLMHPRTGGYIGEVSPPVSLMAVQLAHAWGVPSLGGGSLSTDSAQLDWFAGEEAGRGSILNVLSGGEICGYMGLTKGAMVLYPEKILLDHEVVQVAYEKLCQFRFDPDAMALDVIAEVGPRGHFLAQRHTQRHLRDFRFSPLTQAYREDGSREDPRERAVQEFKKLADSHHPQPLPTPVQRELDRIVKAADKQFSEGNQR